MAAAAPYAIPAAASVAGGLLGGKGAKSAAKAANKPQQSRSQLFPTPWIAGSQDNLNYLVREGRRNYEAGTPEGDDVYALYKKFITEGLSGGGDSGSRSFNRLGRGEGGGKGIRRGLDPNKYQKNVMEGGFLDAGNPFLQAVADSLQEEFAESYERGLVPQIDSRFTGAGVQDGGMRALAQGFANEEYNEAVQSSLSDLYLSNYQNERGLMTDVMGQFAGENASYRSSQAGIIQAQIAAQIQRAILGEDARQFDKNFDFNSLGSLYNVASSRDQLPSQNLGNLANILLPILSTFGVQTGTNSGSEF